ncbi:PREDICTED: uncharacterized protein LOC109332565 [Lupinus angustifolius]|uniref:uncharacterized protein LOC109332565 n=1 Tax=Lupinus angustifolius TaxID=3871 RepID=UPI00092E62B9|nr:PREDICTED: uncharacterized protein LOC109332565 [Lupinus angustifolius]
MLAHNRSSKLMVTITLLGASFLTGYDLLGYIDGSMPCPVKHLDLSTIIINHAFTLWVRHDQLILHAIVSSVAAIVVTHIGTVKTAKQAWDTLKTMYASRSRVRIMALKQRITTFNKGTQPMVAYLQGIKAIVDELSIIEHPLDNIDLVIHTLNGLSSDYFESILHRDINNEPLVATANAALRNRGQPRYRSPHHDQQLSSPPHSKLLCQYCEKPGHNAKKCYKIHGYPMKSAPRPLDLQHMTLVDAYSGSDRVMVGDGTGSEVMSISGAMTS